MHASTSLAGSAVLYLIRETMMVHKIGVSMDPLSRLKELIRERRVELTLSAVYACDDPRAEPRCHDMLRDFRLHRWSGREWFWVCRDDAETVIQRALAGHTTWTSLMPRWGRHTAGNLLAGHDSAVSA